jgi:hypothetical protein
MPKEWSRVKTVELHPTPGTAKVALDALNDEGLPRIVSLLHLKDSTFFEADASQSKMLARIEKLDAQEAAGIKRCINQCEATRPPAKDGEEEAGCSCLEQCNYHCGETVVTRVQQARHQMEAGDFILGPLAKPTSFLRAVSQISGAREPSLFFRQTLVSYQGERAAVVASLVDSGDYLVFVAHVLDWEQLPDGRSRLKSVVSVRVDESEQTTTVTRYVAG